MSRLLLLNQQRQAAHANVMPGGGSWRGTGSSKKKTQTSATEDMDAAVLGN